MVVRLWGGDLLPSQLRLPERNIYWIRENRHKLTLTMVSTEHIFPTLPDTARVWIYTADRQLSQAEQDSLLQAVRPFVEAWTSHGRRVIGEAEVLEGRFLVIASILEKGDISGCGIDASVHAVEEAGQQLGVGWLPGLHIVYRDAQGAAQTATRSEFRSLVRSGLVGAETPVFDAGVTSLGALRQGQFERPAGSSWHANAFQIAGAPA